MQVPDEMCTHVASFRFGYDFFNPFLFVFVSAWSTGYSLEVQRTRTWMHRHACRHATLHFLRMRLWISWTRDFNKLGLGTGVMNWAPGAHVDMTMAGTWGFGVRSRRFI